MQSGCTGAHPRRTRAGQAFVLSGSAAPVVRASKETEPRHGAGTPAPIPTHRSVPCPAMPTSPSHDYVARPCLRRPAVARNAPPCRVIPLTFRLHARSGRARLHKASRTSCPAFRHLFPLRPDIVHFAALLGGLGVDWPWPILPTWRATSFFACAKNSVRYHARHPHPEHVRATPPPSPQRKTPRPRPGRLCVHGVPPDGGAPVSCVR